MRIRLSISVKRAAKNETNTSQHSYIIIVITIHKYRWTCATRFNNCDQLWLDRAHTHSNACMCTLNVVLLSYTPSQTWSTRDRGLRRDTKRSNDRTIQKQLLFSCCRFVRCLCVYSVHSLAVRWFWCLLRARTRSLCCATNEERWKKTNNNIIIEIENIK